MIKYLYPFVLLFSGLLMNGVGIGLLSAQTTVSQSESEVFVLGVVNFRLEDSFKDIGFDGKITDESLQLLFKQLGMADVRNKFPTAVRPQKGLNRWGEPLKDLSRVYTANVAKDKDLMTVCRQLSKHPAIRYAEPEAFDYVHYIPNDTLMYDQWWVSKIQADKAWDITKGDTSVVIGMVDTGFDLDHPDLAAAVFLNTKDPINGIDDDNDGYIDNYTGWDFGGANSNSPVADNNPNVVEGGNSHGSLTSGFANARADNVTGIASPAFKSRFIPVKTNSDNTSGIAHGYEGIVYVAERGCKVINCSWGSPIRLELRQEVIDFVKANYGVLIVASAGNTGTLTTFYPSSYEGIFSVAASDSMDKLSPESTFNYQVDVVAPATFVRCGQYNDMYVSFPQGYTSVAAAVVSSSAGLLQAHYTDWSGEQLGEQLRVTCDLIDTPNADKPVGTYGKGRINLYRALTETSPSIRQKAFSLIDDNDGLPLPGETIELELTLRNYLQPVQNAQVRISSDNPKVLWTKNIISTGALNTNQQKIMSEKFVFSIAPDIEPNSQVWFRLDYTSGTYSDFEYVFITLFPTFINIDENRILTSVNSVGNFGYNNYNKNTQGFGFRHDGSNSWLYEGGLVIAESQDKVYDNIRNFFSTVQDKDFITEDLIKFRDPVRGASLEAEGTFFANFEGQRRITVRQEVLAWKNKLKADESIIILYNVTNNTNEIMPTVHMGLFADWDIGLVTGNSNFNSTRYDAENRLNYTYFDTLFGGIALMNNETVHLRNIQWNEFLSFTDSVKYIAISKGLQNADRDSADVYSFTGTGPFQLLPGETKQYAFLIGASRKLINLVEEVQEQRARYACLNGNSTLRLNHLFIGRSGCANCSRGYILPHFTGGTAPYQYFLNGNAVEMSDLSGLRAGNYNLRIVDAVDCSLEQNLTIKE